MKYSIYRPLSAASSRKLIYEILSSFRNDGMADDHYIALRDAFFLGYFEVRYTRYKGFQRFHIHLNEDFRACLPSYDDAFLRELALRADYYLYTHY